MKHRYFVSYSMALPERGWLPCNTDIMTEDPITTLEDIVRLEKQIFDKENKDKDVMKVVITNWRKFEDFE